MYILFIAELLRVSRVHNNMLISAYTNIAIRRKYVPKSEMCLISSEVHLVCALFRVPYANQHLLAADVCLTMCEYGIYKNLTYIYSC